VEGVLPNGGAVSRRVRDEHGRQHDHALTAAAGVALQTAPSSE
jgi:hypothetical protein